MNFKDGIILPTKALRKCGPYLEKYFGITLGYFNVELENLDMRGRHHMLFRKTKTYIFPFVI